MKDLAPNLATSSISKVNFCIVDSRETPVEEFHFRFKVDQNEKETLSSKDLCLSQIEESLRDFLLRLSDVNLCLKPLDSREDWSFEIEIETDSNLSHDLENP